MSKQDYKSALDYVNSCGYQDAEGLIKFGSCSYADAADWLETYYDEIRSALLSQINEENLCPSCGDSDCLGGCAHE